MAKTIKTVDEYIENCPAERHPALHKLRSTILKNIPKGFEEQISYGMVGYVVPKEIYPNGYHCDPSLPLPFCNLASQKNYIALYHMGIYGSPELLNWFQTEYKKVVPSKLDMGKSCIRFKKMDQIPFDLIGELMKKISVEDWINNYEKTIKK